MCWRCINPKKSLSYVIGICCCRLYMFTGHFIMYILIVLGWTALILHCINSHRYWEHCLKIILTIDIITHTAAADLLHHDITKVLCWIRIGWLWRPSESSELVVMFSKPGNMTRYPAECNQDGTLWYHYTSTTTQNYWYKPGWICGSWRFLQILTQPSDFSEQIETHHPRQGFSNLPLSNVSELVPSVASVSSS